MSYYHVTSPYDIPPPLHGHKITHFIPWIRHKILGYLNNIENFKEYSSTIIFPWLRLINCCTLTSLLSWGKYLGRKASLNSSHSIGHESSGLLSLRNFLNFRRISSCTWFSSTLLAGVLIVFIFVETQGKP